MFTAAFHFQRLRAKFIETKEYKMFAEFVVHFCKQIFDKLEKRCLPTGF